MSQESSPYEVSQSGMSPVSEPPQAPVIQSNVAKVFGIIHIIYASLGMIMGVVGLIAMFAMKSIMGKMEGDMAEAKVFLAAYDDLMIYSYIDVGLKILLGVVLLVSGIGLLKRRLWAQKTSIFWAIARIVAGVGMTLLSIGPAREFQEKINQSGGAQQEQFQQMAQGVGNVMGIVFICIYPVLTLIFLSKKNVKDTLH